MTEVIIHALVAALLLAAMLGPLGAFVVWRRMAYFGDTIAHASLLGVALSLLVGDALPMTFAVFLVAGVVALVLVRYARDRRFHADTVLGILAHSALALGLVLVSLNRSVQVDINAYLFGDVLTTDVADIGLLAMLSMAVVGIIIARWRRLLMATIHPDIAQVEGVNTSREQLILTLLLAAVIAVSIKLTGILLITALLIIPAAGARYLAKSPVQMAVFSGIVGMLSVSGGLLASLQWDVPTAPMMVVVSAALFMGCSLVPRGR